MHARRKALITGVTGQDGSYLAEYLIGLGYEVHGLVRRVSTSNTQRLSHLLSRGPASSAGLHLHYADMADSGRLVALLSEVRPDEVYNLAAQSHVKVSFDEPEQTSSISGLGAVRLLEAIRRAGVETRFYQASTSEMYGESRPPQSESTAFQPCSPYAAAKLYAHWVTQSYRDAYGMFAATGILFNHESPRRGETFVTRKITKAVAAIRAGTQHTLHLGNLEAARDWGYAPEYVIGMWQILQVDEPNDFVLATGQSHTVREFLEIAFSCAGLDWREHVSFDEEYLRPLEVHSLRGDATKARQELGWRSTVTLPELAETMVEADIARLSTASKSAFDAVTLPDWPWRGRA